MRDIVKCKEIKIERITSKDNPINVLQNLYYDLNLNIIWG